jgi:purine-binding chemotaxis protein CheW
VIVAKLRNLQVGLVVDKVSEVADIADGDIEDVPAFGSDLDTAYLLGIAKSNGRIRLLLDIDQVLSFHEVRQLDATVTAPRDAAE